MQTLKKRDRIVLAVTLIAMKREVATEKSVGFPWTMCALRGFAKRKRVPNSNATQTESPL